mgnify:CR=1 FL=1
MEGYTTKIDDYFVINNIKKWIVMVKKSLRFVARKATEKQEKNKFKSWTK